MFGIVGDKDTLLRYRKLVHIRIGETALVKIGCNVFDIKFAIEVWKGAAVGHVFIKQHLVFVKSFRHGVWL